MAFRLQKRETHPATHNQRVDRVEQCFDHGELVADLRTAHDRHERATRVVRKIAKYFHFTMQ